MKSARLTSLTALFGLLFAMSLDAMFENGPYNPSSTVPVQRIIDHVEGRIKQNPSDAHLHYVLARAHAIAYHTQSEVIIAESEDRWGSFGGAEENYGLYRNYGFSTDFDSPPDGRSYKPYELPQRDGEKKSRDTAAEAAKAKAHLRAAIVEYRRAATLAPHDVPALLGYAWCLDEAGAKQSALDAYRKAFEESCKQDDGGAARTNQCITCEIGRYLLKLLKPGENAEEFYKVEARIAHAEGSTGRAITPILIPLRAGTALQELVDEEAKVSFDLDGSGLHRSWGWITPKAGWLVFDPSGSGSITSGLQLFGGVTFWVFWTDGYEVLNALDDDNDGELSGHELEGIAVWQDKNSNGISEPGEILSLSSLGIKSLSCAGESHPTGIRYSPKGVRYSDGSERPSYDWIAPAK